MLLLDEEIIRDIDHMKLIADLFFWLSVDIGHITVSRTRGETLKMKIRSSPVHGLAIEAYCVQTSHKL